MFAHAKTVTQPLALFVPVHTSPLSAWVLSGNNLQYRPVSSALNMSLGSYLLRISWSVLSFQSSHTPLSTEPFSPLILLYAMLWRVFHRLNHPLEQVHSAVGSTSLLSSSAFAFRSSPLIGIDWARVAVNHWKRAASTSGHVGSLWRFCLVLPTVYEERSLALSLRIVLRVLWGIPNSEAISFFAFREVDCQLYLLSLTFFYCQRLVFISTTIRGSS